MLIIPNLLIDDHFEASKYVYPRDRIPRRSEQETTVFAAGLIGVSFSNARFTCTFHVYLASGCVYYSASKSIKTALKNCCDGFIEIGNIACLKFGCLSAKSAKQQNGVFSES